MTTREKPKELESSTIQPIALDQRHGRARDLFTVWFGSNIMLLTVVTGALAVTAFHLPFGWAVVAVTLGNLVGAVFMALHAAQGPTLGVPQMVQTRGQFGSLGSLLVVGIVIIMYVGFCASNLVVGGESLDALIPSLAGVAGGAALKDFALSLGAAPGILFIGLLSFFAAVWGHDMIHYYARIMTLLSGIALLAAFACVFGAQALPADFFTRNAVSVGGFLGAVSVAAVWQIAYAPYVSDYSRYLPADTGARSAFWASYWGCALGSIFPMILGISVALTVTGKEVVGALARETGVLAAPILLAFSVSIAITTAVNLYCGALSCLTFGQTLLPRWSPRARARIIAVVVLTSLSIAIALLAAHSFLSNYEDFILFLLYLLVPWTAINLVDYYLVQHGQYNVADFLRADGGIYGRVNIPAVTCYVLGFIVQVPFISSALYEGPVAKMLGDADLSWIVGLVFTSIVYYAWARGIKAQESTNAGLAGSVQAKAGAA